MDNAPDFTLLFDLQRDGTDVWQALTAGAEADGLVELVQGMRSHPPIAPTCEPFERGPEFRPAGHMRTFYRRLHSGHVAIKGSEPLITDVREMGRKAAHLRVTRSVLATAEWFPAIERLVP